MLMLSPLFGEQEPIQLPDSTALVVLKSSTLEWRKSNYSKILIANREMALQNSMEYVS